LPYGFGSSSGSVGYILTTGVRWKNGIIKRIEIFIRSEFSTMLNFEENGFLSFETIGESKKLDSQFIQGDLGIYETYSLYLMKNKKDNTTTHNRTVYVF
jgi:hypothetical protein